MYGVWCAREISSGPSWVNVPLVGRYDVRVYVHRNVAKCRPDFHECAHLFEHVNVVQTVMLFVCLGEPAGHLERIPITSSGVYGRRRFPRLEHA